MPDNGTEETFILRKRHRYERGFTITDNRLLQDTKRLSYRAIGLMAHMWSLPDGALLSATALAGKGKEGREAVRAALNELAAAGYVKRERTSRGRGQWVHTVTLADVPMSDKAAGQFMGGFSGPDTPTVGELGDKDVKDQGKDSPSPNGDGRANTQLASFLDRSGLTLTKQTRARLGRSIKGLTSEPAEDVAAGLDLWGERFSEGAKLSPEHLPQLVDQARNRQAAKVEEQRERQRRDPARQRVDHDGKHDESCWCWRVPDDRRAKVHHGELLEAAGISPEEAAVAKERLAAGDDASREQAAEVIEAEAGQP